VAALDCIQDVGYPGAAKNHGATDNMGVPLTAARGAAGPLTRERSGLSSMLNGPQAWINGLTSGPITSAAPDRVLDVELVRWL
jgi:hypothetical protein